MLLIQRYVATTSAVRYLTRITTEDNNAGTQRKQKKKTTKRPENSGGGSSSDGGGEVYDMFSLSNRCTLNEQLVDRIKVIASPTLPSITNYCQKSSNGTMFYDPIVQDIQKRMNLYYKFKKPKFSKKLFEHAFEYMEVYIKTMYLVERGLVQSYPVQADEDTSMETDTLAVNILWGDSMSKF